MILLTRCIHVFACHGPIPHRVSRLISSNSNAPILRAVSTSSTLISSHLQTIVDESIHNTPFLIDCSFVVCHLYSLNKVSLPSPTFVPLSDFDNALVNVVILFTLYIVWSRSFIAFIPAICPVNIMDLIDVMPAALPAT